MIEGPGERCRGVAGSVTSEQPTADSQPESGDLSPTGTGNRILPTTTHSHADAFIAIQDPEQDSAKPWPDS